MLEKLGYCVDTVNNGYEVLAALARKPYDIILMDCQMPEMDGFEATREIRSIEGGARHTTIIAMTANALKGDFERCIRAGMDDYLSKPVDYRKMSAMIDSWLLKLDPPGTLSLPYRETNVVGDNKLASDGFDKAAFMDRILGDKALARELIEMFILETPDQIEALGQAVKSGDSEQVRRYAHKIRGAAVNMCGWKLGDKAAEIECVGKTGTLSGLDGLIAELLMNFHAMKIEMEAGFCYFQPDE